MKNSSFELMRIISMFLIVLWHIIELTGLLSVTDGMSRFILQFIMLLCAVHVNSFILLTGYFQYKKEFKIKKLLKIFNAQWFYSIVIGIGITIILSISLTNRELLRMISPFDYGNYWFVWVYLILYILSPYLNKTIKNMNQKEHRRLIILLILCFSILPNLTAGHTISNNGFNIIWFVCLYFIGSYLAKYPIRENIHFKHFSNSKKRMIFFSLMIFFAILNFIFSYMAHNLSHFGGDIFSDYMGRIRMTYLNYSNPLILLQTIFYFLYFETYQYKNKIINFISALMFGVFLVHYHLLMRPIISRLYFDIFGNRLESTGYLIISILLYALMIFVGAAFIEMIRQFIFKFIEKRKTSRKLSKKFWKYIDNY